MAWSRLDRRKAGKKKSLLGGGIMTKEKNTMVLIAGRQRVRKSSEMRVYLSVT